MKKFLTYLLIIMMMAAMLTGCGDTKDTKTEDTQAKTSESSEKADTGEMGDLLSSAYVDMMKGDKYVMKYTAAMDMEGQTIQVESTIAVSGEDTAMINSGEGFDATTIIKDGYVYMVDHASKTVMKWAQSQADEETGTLPADDMTYKATGKEDGLVYEEYATADGSVKYYFDGKDLVKIASTTEGQTVVMENIEISKDVSDSMFEVPAGYQEVSM